MGLDGVGTDEEAPSAREAAVGAQGCRQGAGQGGLEPVPHQACEGLGSALEAAAAVCLWEPIEVEVVRGVGRAGGQC